MTGCTLERRVKLTDRLATKFPRKLLAIDGGAIRGVLSLMILNKMEKLLIEESRREDYRLADYFDYVSGTSTRWNHRGGDSDGDVGRGNSRLLCQQRCQDVRQGKYLSLSADEVRERAACLAAQERL